MTVAHNHNPHLHYRPDIDGLRALAILSVLTFHAFPQSLPGGFIGVDIFFVISGYLITGIILKAHHINGFSLLEFYSRRIKRIFPALILVLIFCLTAGWYILQADEYQSLGKHVAAGAGYVSNIVLMGELGYFDTAAELKPLLHLWSLGIEEQFYLVWPLLLMLTFRARFNPLVTISLLLAASFLLNAAYIGTEPVHVFYLPFTRSWELLVGSVLAYVAFMRTSALYAFGHDKPRERQANRLAWFGISLIVMSLVMLHKNSSFPGWLAVLPTVGAGCLIAAGEHAWFNRHVLANKAAVYIGLISYPLYLWHWPLLSFAHIVENETPSWSIRLGALGLSFGLAWATYWLVEKRLRFRAHWAIAAGLLFALVMAGIAGYEVTRHEGYPNRIKQVDPRAIELGAANWAKKGLNAQASCSERFGRGSSEYCMIQDASRPPTVLLLGDSTANHFFPGLAKAYEALGENVLNLGQGGCPPFAGIEIVMAEGRLHCGKVVDEILAFAEKTATVKMVAISATGAAYMTGNRSLFNKGKEDNFVRVERSQNVGERDPNEVFRIAMRDTLRKLVATGKQIIFIESVPRLNLNPTGCLDVRPWQAGHSKPRKSCTVPLSVVREDDGAYRALAADVLREFPSVKVWDPSRELCDEQGCWAMKDGVLLYRDDVHLSESGSLWLGARYHLK